MARKVPDPIDKYVGSRVRMRRMMLGMSQQNLAGKLGVTFQQVQKYEKGTNRISASRLQAMSHILQVPIPFFFEGAPQTARQSRRGGEAPFPAYVSEFLANSDGLKTGPSIQADQRPRTEARCCPPRRANRWRGTTANATPSYRSVGPAPGAVIDARDFDFCAAHAVGDNVGRFGYHEFARAGDAARRAELRVFLQQIFDAVEDVQGDALCGGWIMFGDVRAQSDEVVDGFRRP